MAKKHLMLFRYFSLFYDSFILMLQKTLLSFVALFSKICPNYMLKRLDTYIPKFNYLTFSFHDAWWTQPNLVCGFKALIVIQLDITDVICTWNRYLLANLSKSKKSNLFHFNLTCDITRINNLVSSHINYLIRKVLVRGYRKAFDFVKSDQWFRRS